MKKLLTIIGLTTSMAIFVNNAKAQKISVGANFGFLKPSNVEGHMGIMLQAKYSLNDNMRLGINLGYYFKSYSLGESSIKSILSPYTATFEYLFSTEGFKPYAGLDLGVYRWVVSGEGLAIGASNFGIAPTLGTDYDISEKFGINANFKYNYIMTQVASTGAISFNAGIYIKF